MLDDDDVYDETPAEAIVMVSVPDSSSNDEFQTPPEGSLLSSSQDIPITFVDAQEFHQTDDVGDSIDLGKESDHLGFSGPKNSTRHKVLELPKENVGNSQPIVAEENAGTEVLQLESENVVDDLLLDEETVVLGKDSDNLGFSGVIKSQEPEAKRKKSSSQNEDKVFLEMPQRETEDKLGHIMPDHMNKNAETNCEEGAKTDVLQLESENVVEDLGKDSDKLGVSGVIKSKEPEAKRKKSSTQNEVIEFLDDNVGNSQSIVAQIELEENASTKVLELESKKVVEGLVVNEDTLFVEMPQRETGDNLGHLMPDHMDKNVESNCEESANTDVLELESENVVEDLVLDDKDQVDDQHSGKGEAVGGRRKLPPTLTGQAKITTQEQETAKGQFLKSLLDGLEMVVGKLADVPEDEDTDFLETAKRRGMTFPRPRWWPPEGFED